MKERPEITFTLHGLDQFNQDVDGEVFAEKFSIFVHGLANADKAVNGKRRHKYLLTDLRKNTATASLREQQTVSGPTPDSSIIYYESGLEAVYSNSPSARALPLALVKDIFVLNKGVGNTFAFGEIKSNSGTVIRIDEYFEKRAQVILNELEATERQLLTMYAGVAFGSFDGVLKAIDLRGEMQKAFLVLTAGGKQIECAVNALAVDKLREALDRRVSASGMAHYNGLSGLPTRLDIRNLVLLKPRHEINLAPWRGSFDMLEVSGDEGWG